MSRAEDTVVIKNIYYMMAYAFKAIGIVDFKRLEVESFGNVLDLLAAILTAGGTVKNLAHFPTVP